MTLPHTIQKSNQMILTTHSLEQAIFMQDNLNETDMNGSTSTWYAKTTATTVIKIHILMDETRYGKKHDSE